MKWKLGKTEKLQSHLEEEKKAVSVSYLSPRGRCYKIIIVIKLALLPRTFLPLESLSKLLTLT